MAKSVRTVSIECIASLLTVHRAIRRCAKENDNVKKMKYKVKKIAVR